MAMRKRSPSNSHRWSPVLLTVDILVSLPQRPLLLGQAQVSRLRQVSLREVQDNIYTGKVKEHSHPPKGRHSFLRPSL